MSFVWFVQADISLIHEACLARVDVSTLDLLLSILSEANHDINSKNKVRLWHAVTRLGCDPNLTMAGMGLTMTCVFAVWSDAAPCGLCKPQDATVIPIS